MYAKDIMTTEVIKVSPNMMIKEAIKVLIDSAISGLMVVNEREELIGVVSEKDFMVTCLTILTVLRLRRSRR